MVLESTVREGKMPKPGFKSITISEQVYEKFYDVYEKNKEKLTMKGVNSFAGYITYMLEDSMLKDKTFAKYAPKLELISIEDDRVIVKTELQKLFSREESYIVNYVRQKIVTVLVMSGQYQKFMRN